MGYYNVEDYVRQKKQHAKEISVPPRANLLAAANHLRAIFEAKKLAYGFMGGLEMLCLGYRREMPDLQIAYNDKDFHRIKAKLESDQRVRLPEGINSLFPARLLVRTGPAFKDRDCTYSGDIEVDIIPPSSHGTPPSGALANNIVLLSLKTEGKLRTYKGLNMLHLVKTLVEFCRVSGLAWDPRKDILFLCQHYGEQIESVRSQLDQKTMKQNFLGTSFFSRLPPEDQRRCYQVLLGTNPPPTMAITPPAPSSHKHSASAPDLPGPRVNPHKSSSSRSLDRSAQLLSAPTSGKSESSHIDSFRIGRPTSSKDCSETSATTRESRPRYRQVSETNSQDISPIDAQVATSKHLRQHSQPPPTAHIISPGIRSHNTSHPMQLPPHIASITTTQGTKSMPNLNKALCGSAPPYAFSQMPPSVGFGKVPHITHSHIAPVEMAASPVTLSPGQQPIKSKAGVAAGISQHQPTEKASMMNRPRPPRQKISREEPVSDITIMGRPRPPRTRSPKQEPTRAELSATPMPEDRARQLHVVNPDITAPMVDNHAATLPQSLSPVELDAMSELKQFIAELSIERSTPAPQSAEPDFPTSLIPNNSAMHSPSPSSAPEPQMLLPRLSILHDSHHRDIPIRPLKTRTTSAPLEAFPTSLRPGGLAAHNRTASTCSGNSPAVNAIPLATNASKYTNLTAPFTPPPSLPNSPQPTYIAYNPTPTPALPPFMPLSPPSSTAPADRSETLDSPESPESPERQDRFSRLIDVDGVGGYFKDKHGRDKSADTRALAMEYQAELPVFGEGYWKISLDFERSTGRPRSQGA